MIGISRAQWRLLATSLTLGGNVRAGLEDNLYLPSGEMARSNGELVAKARQMAEDIGRKIATPAEARKMLGLEEKTHAPVGLPYARTFEPFPDASRSAGSRPGAAGSAEGSRERSFAEDFGLVGGVGRAGGDDPPLPARGPASGAGQDLAQHGLLPARVRRADPADQAAPGGAVHAAAGDPRAARLGRRRPRPGPRGRRRRRRGLASGRWPRSASGSPSRAARAHEIPARALDRLAELGV